MARKRKSKGSDNTLLYVGIAVVAYLFLSGGNANAQEPPKEYPEYPGYIPGTTTNPNGTTVKPGYVKEVDPITMQFNPLPDFTYASSGPARGNLSGLGNNDMCLY